MTVTLMAPLGEIELSPGSAIALPGLTWQHYQLALLELGESRATRLAYSQGVLEIRMPSPWHEIINRLLSKLIFTLAEESGLDCLDFGSTTWDREDLDRGIEPDSCFFIQNAHLVAGLRPAIPADLPPDLAVEVDIANRSERKLAIYQAIAVPEVWIYRTGQVTIWLLSEAGYAEAARSRALPAVSAAQLQAWLALRETVGDVQIVRTVREFVRAARA